MGNQDSCITNASPEPVENLELTHLGPATLMRSNQTYCLLKVFSFTDSFLMQERLRKFKARVAKISENAHVLNMYSVTKMEKKQLCANNYQLHVFLERPDYTLGDVITRRLREKRNFNEQELFLFLGKVVNTLIYIQDNGLKNIQIDAEAIFCCGDNVKVLDCAISASKTYYQLLDRREKGIEISGNNIYLAPQLLKQLKQLNYDPYISPKADIFSLGMLLLEMVTLEPMHGYYDYQAATIDYDSLIHRLSRINHSLPLKTLIAEMLEFDPEERVGLVSLKQKIHKLKNPQTDQAQIARSKSSKMLKELLSQSRRSGSLSRQGQGSSSLSRQPSTQRKNNSRIQVHCNSGKKIDIMRETESKELQDSKDKKEPLPKKQAMILNAHYQSSIDQVQFKNLVKNRLVKDKERNKENSQASTQSKNLTKLPNHPKLGLVQTRMLLERNSNRVDSISSNKFESSASSNIFESSLGYNKASLSKLVEDSGLKNLLKIEQLNESGFKKSHPQSMKNTSRFGNCENSEVKQKSIVTKNHGLRKISEIYIREEENSEVDIPLITVREPISHERQLQKVMTFNNKEFLISARSVEASVEEISPNRRGNEQKLVFSPIATEQRQNQSCEEESPDAKMTIKDVPVVISQQKVYEPTITPQNYGRVQRNLHLLDCAQSIEQDSILNDGNFSSSKVIESFKPQGNEDEYRSAGINTSKVESYSRQNSCFLKKNKGKKPELNIQLHDEEQDNYTPINSFQQKRNDNKINETSYQKAPTAKSKFAKLDYLYKTSQSIEQLSNFTSISPPQDSKDSNSTFQVLFEPNHFSAKQEETTSGSILKKIVLNNGDLYQGELSSEGVPHGNGILQCSNLYQYSGSFKNGKFNGYGTLLNLYYRPSPVDYKNIDLSKGYWTRFQGEFDNGTKTGFGTIYFQEGQKFSGCLKRDTIEGYGCFYKKSGQLISGLWGDNKFKKI